MGMTDTRTVDLIVREARQRDLDEIVEIDRQASGVKKTRYWKDTLQRYSRKTDPEYFLVAERQQEVLGFVVGEIRAWEFGSPLCGWVYAIGVGSHSQLEGVGSTLMDALCARFRLAGVRKVRTMISRKDHELLSFFRSYNMMAGPFQQLELDLETQKKIAVGEEGARA